MFIKLEANFRDGEATRRAEDQARAQCFFQRGNTLAQRRFRHVKRAACSRKPFAVDHLREVINIIEIQHSYSSVHACGRIVPALVLAEPRVRFYDAPVTTWSEDGSSSRAGSDSQA